MIINVNFLVAVSRISPLTISKVAQHDCLQLPVEGRRESCSFNTLTSIAVDGLSFLSLGPRTVSFKGSPEFLTQLYQPTLCVDAD